MQALASRGIAVNPQHIRSGDYREDRAYSVAREILRLPDRPTAFFVANNLMLIGVMRAISEAGLNCPADISVVSMDDFMWVNAFRPRLTTVSQPMAEMGAEAVRLLVERLTAASGEPPRRVVMQPTLIVRESCAPYHA
jgi:LacI family transcriptional regulator